MNSQMNSTLSKKMQFARDKRQSCVMICFIGETVGFGGETLNEPKLYFEREAYGY